MGYFGVYNGLYLGNYIGAVGNVTPPVDNSFPMPVGFPLTSPEYYSAYPTEQNVIDLLDSAGMLTPTTNTDLLRIPARLNAMVAQFEQDTGYNPFLATGVQETRKFRKDIPTQLWDMLGGIIPGSITLATHTGLFDEFGTTTFVLDVEEWYTMVPYDPAPRKRPYEYFKLAMHGRVGVIAVTAVWGYWTSLQADVWEAILTGTAALIYYQTKNKLDAEGGGPVQRIKRGELEVELASTQAERMALYNSWLQNYKTAVNNYKRDLIY